MTVPILDGGISPLYRLLYINGLHKLISFAAKHSLAYLVRPARSFWQAATEAIFEPAFLYLWVLSVLSHLYQFTKGDFCVRYRPIRTDLWC